MKSKKLRGIDSLKSKYGLMFVSIWIIGFVLFFLIPLLQSLIYSFSEVVVGSGGNKIPIGKTSHLWFGANSLSILEPVIRMYNLTDDKKYLDFAEYLVKSGPDGKDNNIFELAFQGEAAAEAR